MSVYKKLQEARVKLQSLKISKGGRNDYAKYSYLELKDFLPEIQDICYQVGLCGIVSFTQDLAYLTIHEIEGEGFITFTSPMSSAALKGCHEVQNLGAVQTYLRRYLWVNAFEIVEHDALEPLVGIPDKEPSPIKNKPIVKVEAPKVVPKAEPKVEPKKEEFFDSSEPWQVSVDVSKDGWPVAVKEGIAILIKLAKKPEDVNSIYRINMQLLEQLKVKDVAVFDEIFATFKTTKEALKGTE